MKKTMVKNPVTVEIKFVILDGKVVALGSEGRLYRIELNPPSCECKDYLMRQKDHQGLCKHLRAAIGQARKWEFAQAHRAATRKIKREGG